MKKLLSVLLVLAMLCGVGAVNAWAETWEDWEDDENWNNGCDFREFMTLTLEEQYDEIWAFVRPLRAYWIYAFFFEEYPVIEAERAATPKMVAETPSLVTVDFPLPIFRLDLDALNPMKKLPPGPCAGWFYFPGV